MPDAARCRLSRQHIWPQRSGVPQETWGSRGVAPSGDVSLLHHQCSHHQCQFFEEEKKERLDQGWVTCTSFSAKAPSSRLEAQVELVI